MARGGRRQGQPGKSYSNRTDLLSDRVPEPGSSANTPPAPSEQGPAPSWIKPDDIPTMDTPTLFPNRPVTDGIASGPGTGLVTASRLADRPLYDPLKAALRRDPTNYALRRVAAYLEAKNG